jgi:hypothetical protein
MISRCASRHNQRPDAGLEQRVGEQAVLDRQLGGAQYLSRRASLDFFKAPLLRQHLFSALRLAPAFHRHIDRHWLASR